MPCRESSETQSRCYSWEREVRVTADVSLKIPQNKIEIVVCPHWAYSVWFRMPKFSKGFLKSYYEFSRARCRKDPKTEEITPIFSMPTSKALFIHCLIFTIVPKYHKWENRFPKFLPGQKKQKQNENLGWFSPKAPRPRPCSLTHSLTLLPPSLSSLLPYSWLDFYL